MRTAHVLALVTVLVTVLATACAGPASGSEPLPNGDLARFVEEVQPYLTRDCASGGCHGRAERPYALFAPGQYRRDPARTHLDEPLDAIELDANARRTAAFAIGVAPHDALVVRKPLALRRGGVWHGGGEVWTDPDDQGCAALIAWLASAAVPQDAALGGGDGGVP